MKDKKTKTIKGECKIELSHGVCNNPKHKKRDTNDISDGYHTFGELYEHRITIFIALCRHVVERGMFPVWKSELHSDGTSFDGWFILGINKKKGEQMTYHIPLSRWEDIDVAETLKKAPKWDGHTSDDVLERIKEL